MKNSNIKKIMLIILLLSLFGCYIWLRVENSQYVHEPRTSFGDTHEFLGVAKEPLFSRLFWISLRPPSVPLIYKILGGDVPRISTFQLWFSIFAWGFLAFGVASTIRSFLLKPIAFAIILAFGLIKEIIMWDFIILGDSISISLMVLFFASALLLLAKWNFVRLPILLITALLFTFARDDFAYYILMFGIALLVLLLRTHHWKRILIISSVFVLMFIASNYFASLSLRWYRPLLNTIGLRILPNPNYVSYFEARGMPISPALMERSGKHLHADNNAILVDPRLEIFRDWIQENGKQEYIRFLWFFKADTLQNPFSNLDVIFSPDLYYYSATGFRPIIQNMRLDEILYPRRFGFVLFLFANLVAAALTVVAVYEKKLTWVLPILLILSTYPQAVLVWNADANDLARHSLYHNVMMRLGFWILVLFLVDYLIEKIDFKQLIGIFYDFNR